MQTTNNPQEFKKVITKTTRVIFQSNDLRIEARKVHNRDSRRYFQLKYYYLIGNAWKPFSTFVSNTVIDCIADLDYQFKIFKVC